MRPVGLCFLLGNVTLVTLSILLIFGPCNAGKFDSENSLGLEYISTKLLRCKYSDYAACYILPPTILVNVALIIVQIHHTACLLGHHSSYCDVFCYLSVLGFCAVILFDSQRVSVRIHQEYCHVLGVVLLTVSALVLHWLCLDTLKNYETYTYIEYIYAICLIAFIVLFAMNVPAAIQIEYLILVVFYILSIINLTIQFRAPCASSSQSAPKKYGIVTCLFSTAVLAGTYAWGLYASGG